VDESDDDEVALALAEATAEPETPPEATAEPETRPEADR
jgi:hypothetical protein